MKAKQLPIALRRMWSLRHISEVAQGQDGAWYGKIVDPREGASYLAKLWFDSDGRLNLRGYVGIALLGSTQVWSRFAGRLVGIVASDDVAGSLI